MYYSKAEYKNMITPNKDLKIMFKNAFSAFLGGGIICLMGQIIYYIFNSLFLINVTDSRTYTVGVIILLAGVLSAMGVYDKLGQIFKCGTIIPICGFANATISAAMEYRPEGLILGVGANAFKLSGAVIVFGVTSAYIVGLIRYLVYLL